MWKALLPQIPQYLLLGKGYAVSKMDFEILTGSDASIHAAAGFAENQYMALAGGYHNGVLSLLLPFGIWGFISYLWFLCAGVYVLYCNWKYGDPEWKTINLLLFVQFLLEFVGFMSCVAGTSIENALPNLAGRLGFSIALNNGICRPAPQLAQASQPVAPAGPFPRPVFQR